MRCISKNTSAICTGMKRQNNRENLDAEDEGKAHQMVPRYIHMVKTFLCIWFHSLGKKRAIKIG